MKCKREIERENARSGTKIGVEDDVAPTTKKTGQVTHPVGPTTFFFFFLNIHYSHAALAWTMASRSQLVTLIQRDYVQRQNGQLVGRTGGPTTNNSQRRRRCKTSQHKGLHCALLPTYHRISDKQVSEVFVGGRWVTEESTDSAAFSLSREVSC